MSQFEPPVSPPPVPAGQAPPPVPTGEMPPSGPAAPPIPAQPQKNWWGRNWKWFVPTGCLTLIVVVGGCIAGIVGLVFSMLKSSDAYRDALAAAKASVVVQKALGTPIEEGFLVSGNINVSGTSGNANLAIPISGPKGEATIYVVATKSAGKWTFEKLDVVVKGTHERIDLLEKPGGNAREEP
ncbi:MAG TPA: cytochrome c oxidase assembly factor 1 family protein [Planctomycetota bacterium]|nr:cytochrome c oxidase assembly factor 1 family protein [Planctomycetota bacterium]